MMLSRTLQFAVAAGFSFTSLNAGAATTPRIKPTVSYSEAIDCPHGSRTNYFDFTYFNSEIALGSQVWIQFGFERGGVPGTGWTEYRMLEMRQWEQFGWFIRISRDMACGLNQSNLSGVDFVVQIKSPDGQVVLEPALDQGFQGYYRASLPNMPGCSMGDGGPLRTCAAEVQWVNGP